MTPELLRVLDVIDPLGKETTPLTVKLFTVILDVAILDVVILETLRLDPEALLYEIETTLRFEIDALEIVALLMMLRLDPLALEKEIFEVLRLDPVALLNPKVAREIAEI